MVSTVRNFEGGRGGRRTGAGPVAIPRASAGLLRLKSPDSTGHRSLPPETQPRLARAAAHSGAHSRASLSVVLPESTEISHTATDQ